MVKNLPAMQRPGFDPWVGNEMFLVKQSGSQRAVLCLPVACCFLSPCSWVFFSGVTLSYNLCHIAAAPVREPPVTQ